MAHSIHIQEVYWLTFSFALNLFVAAQSSSRSIAVRLSVSGSVGLSVRSSVRLLVRPSVSPLVRASVRWSADDCEKVIKKNHKKNLFSTKKSNSNCDETQLKLLWNSNCDETQKPNFRWNSKTQIVMKLKNSNGNETQWLKLWGNSKTQTVMNIKNSICDETQKLNLLWNSKLNLIKT